MFVQANLCIFIAAAWSLQLVQLCFTWRCRSSNMVQHLLRCCCCPGCSCTAGSCSCCSGCSCWRQSTQGEELLLVRCACVASVTTIFAGHQLSSTQLCLFLGLAPFALLSSQSA
jgi:hypothetical protein